MEQGMEPGIDIRRRKDGSIDIGHYLTIARDEREAALRRGVWALVTAPGRLRRGIVTISAELWNAALRSEKA